MVDMPIKCPVAPLEFCFLADWYLRERGVREDVELIYATPLDAAFTKPIASRATGGLLEDKGIELETEFATGQVDGDGRPADQLGRAGESRSTLVTIPLHGGAAFIVRSPGLGDELGFVRADQQPCNPGPRPNVFAIGDATNVPTSKAGSVTHSRPRR